MWDLISEWLFGKRWIRRGLIALVAVGVVLNFRSMSSEAWIATALLFAFFAFFEIADYLRWGRRGKDRP